MDIAEIKWDPISIREIYHLFSRFEIPWWISGGWALDLFIGRQTREHEDNGFTADFRPSGAIFRNWV